MHECVNVSADKCCSMHDAADHGTRTMDVSVLATMLIMAGCSQLCAYRLSQTLIVLNLIVQCIFAFVSTSTSIMLSPQLKLMGTVL